MAAMPKGVMVPKRLTTPLQRLREEEIAFTVNSDMMHWAYWGNKLIKQKTVNTEVFIELLDSVEISEEQKHRLDALFEKIKGPWKEEVDDDEDFYGRVSRLYEAYDSMINDIKSIVPSKYDHFMYKSLPEDESFVCACYVFYPRQEQQEQQQQQQVSRVDKIRMQLVEQQLRREPAWLMMVVASTSSVEMAVGGLMFEIQSMFREQPWRKCALGVVAVLDWHLWLFFFVPGKLFPLGTIAMNFDDEKKPQGWPIRNLARLMCVDPVDLGLQAELAAAAAAATAAAQQQPLQQPLQPLSSTSSSPQLPVAVAAAAVSGTRSSHRHRRWR